MKLLNLVYESKSVLLPTVGIPIGLAFFNPITTIMMAKVIKEIEPKVLSIECPLDGTWMTSRLEYYNLLDYDYPQLRSLEKFIKDSYTEYMNGFNFPTTDIYCHAWINILRSGERITKHNHADAHTKLPTDYCYMSGNLCIQVTDTATRFESPYSGSFHDINNHNGEMVLFPSFMNHETTKNNTDTPRYTIAFDIITEEMYNLTPNKQLFKKL